MARFNRNTTNSPGRSPSRRGLPARSSARICVWSVRRRPWDIGSPTSVTVSPDGKSVYKSTSQAKQRRGAPEPQRRPPGRSQPSRPGANLGCISATGAGPCANDLSPLCVPTEDLLASGYNPPRCAIPLQPRHDHRGDHAARTGTAGCVSETGAGNLCRRPWAGSPLLGGGQRRRIRASTIASLGSDAVARFNRAPECSKRRPDFRPPTALEAAGCGSRPGKSA